MSSTPRRTAQRAAALAGAVLVGVSATGCASGDVTVADDEYAGRAVTANPTELATHPAAQATSGQGAPAPTGSYADGSYTDSESYGVVDGVIEEDSIDVTLTLTGGYVTDVAVTGHPLLERSQDFMRDFVSQVKGAVVGRSIEDAHVDALAGASKTSAAFNKAVDAIREQAASAAPGS